MCLVMQASLFGFRAVVEFVICLSVILDCGPAVNTFL